MLNFCVERWVGRFIGCVLSAQDEGSKRFTAAGEAARVRSVPLLLTHCAGRAKSVPEMNSSYIEVSVARG